MANVKLSEIANGSALVPATDKVVAVRSGTTDVLVSMDALNATTLTVADTTDSTCFPALFESATGDLAPKTDGALTYDASTGNLSATGFTGVGGTVTASTPVLNISQTWNNAAIQFRALDISITNTASNSVSPVIYAAVDGSQIFRLNRTGNATFSGTINSSSIFANSLTCTGSGVEIPLNTAFGWSSNSRLISNANGRIVLYNNALDDFSRLQFGGITSSFPAIKRNATALNFRLADDSADCPITASTGTFSGAINKVTITAPATASTLTIADGKTLTASNSITLAGTDSTTMTFPSESASVGYLGSPQNSQSAAYELVLADAGKHIYHPAADTTARTFTIPANASVAFPVGTVIGIVNENAAGAITLAITSDTLRWGSSTGSRTIAANGTATLLKVTSTVWRLTGDGIT